MLLLYSDSVIEDLIQPILALEKSISADVVSGIHTRRYSQVRSYLGVASETEPAGPSSSAHRL